MTFTDPYPATDVALTQDGSLLATALQYRNLRQFSPGAEPVTLPADSPTTRLAASSLVFSPDGRLLISGSPYGALVVRDIATALDLLVKPTGQGPIEDVATTPDGTLIATAGSNRTIKLWNARTYELVATLDKHTGPVTALAVSPDGRYLASAGEDRTVIVWNLTTHEPTAILTGHSGPVRALTFTGPASLAAGGDDHRIIQWTLDPRPATTRLCRQIARDLTQEEWTTHLPSLPYRPTCS